MREKTRLTAGLAACIAFVCCAGFAGVGFSQDVSRPKPRFFEALARGLEPGGNLYKELNALGEYEVHTESDGVAICAALKKFPQKPAKREVASPLSLLIRLFQDVDVRSPAYGVLKGDGTTELCRLVDVALTAPGEIENYDALLALRVLATYHTLEGTQQVIKASKANFQPENHAWNAIFGAYTADHPHVALFFDEFAEQLPAGFAGVCLAEVANVALSEGAPIKHPFNTPGGKRRLESWLTDKEPARSSYGRSAAATLPFISEPQQTLLLSLATRHPDPGVRMDGAWAAGAVGKSAGFEMLAQFCLDVNHSTIAQRYLTALNRADAIPEAAQDRGFRARAEFAHWLAYTRELGRPPDSLEIIDSRKLRWPTNRKVKTFWIIKYEAKAKSPLDDDEVDCGLVGSDTYCFFELGMEQRPPQDIYSIHCVRELSHAGRVTNLQLTAQESTELLQKVAAGHSEKYENLEFVFAYKLDAKLKLGEEPIVLASGKRSGEPGWAVFDGPRTTWYPASEQPGRPWTYAVLCIHIGHHLLGFSETPDRKQFLKEKVAKDPALIVKAYQELLDKVHAGSQQQREELLVQYDSPLSEHFENYAEALATVKGITQQQATTEAYEKLLAVALATPDEFRSQLMLDSVVLSAYFGSYVSAQLDAGKAGVVKEQIALLDRYWSSDEDGQAKLGRASFDAGDFALAEKYLAKLPPDDYTRDMSLLAECWHRQGKHDNARKLLVDSLQRQVELAGEDDEEVLDYYDEEFQHYRMTLERLYPAEAQKLLADHKLPKTLLKTAQP